MKIMNQKRTEKSTTDDKGREQRRDKQHEAKKTNKDTVWRNNNMQALVIQAKASKQ